MWRKILPLSLLGVGLSYFACLVGRFTRDICFDDFFITAVYGRHLREHGAFFWNTSGRLVDGFSSFLDVVVKALLPGSDPLFSAALTNVAWHALAAILLLFLLFREEALSSRGDVLRAVLAVVALIFSPPLVDASSFLLEGTMFADFLLLSLLLLDPVRGGAWSASLFSAAVLAMTLSRPEGLAFAAVFLWFWWRSSLKRFPLLPLIIVGLVLSAYFFWHIRTFGYWAPNTYYAKSSDRRILEVLDGARYVWRFLSSPFGALSAISLVLASMGLVGATRRWRAATALFWGSLAIVIFSGGDCYGNPRERAEECFRFLVVPAVLSPFLLALFVSRTRRLPRMLATALLGSLAFVSACGMWTRFYAAHGEDGSQALRFPSLRDDCPFDQEIAEKLRAAVPNPTIAHTDYQRIKYFFDAASTRDLTGLVDSHIAHRPYPAQNLWGKHDLAAAMIIQPDFWQIGSPSPQSESVAAYSATDVMFSDELFVRFFGRFFQTHPPSQSFRKGVFAQYTFASVATKGGFFNFLVRRDVVSRATPLLVSVE